jgi:hypothetical protein
MDIKPVIRTTRQEFSDTKWRGEPRVIVGNVPHWNASGLWSAPYLEEKAGYRKVLVRAKQGTAANTHSNSDAGGQILFSRYLEWVLDASIDLQDICRGCTDATGIAKAVAKSGMGASYYLDTSLTELSANLAADAPAPDWGASKPTGTRLWCGVLGTSCGTHADALPNCNVQVMGNKHFLLFPPSQGRFLYRMRGSTQCRFDPVLPDFERFPLARQASGLECTLKPGESLYIPAGWYYQVTVVSGWAVNVNFLWPRPIMQTLATPSLWEPLAYGQATELRRAFTALLPVREKKAPRLQE